MYSKSAEDHWHFSTVRAYETKALHAYAAPYRSRDEDTTALILALTGVALMVVTIVSMLFAFRVL